MKKLSASLALCEGIHRSPVDFPHKGPVKRAFKISLALVWQTFELTATLSVIWGAVGSCDVTVMEKKLRVNAVVLA